MSSGGREEGMCKVCGAWSSGVSYRFHGTCLAHAPAPVDVQAVARGVFKQVRRLFIWTCDQENFGVPEHWSSFADDVEQGKVFRGDCDNFALTCAELLHRRGINPSLIRIALCYVETGEYHAVCIADGWCLDNRQRAVWHWSKLPYRWDRSMRMDEVGVWRKA